MTARRHHFVSQCYLKGFAVRLKTGKHQLQVFDRERAKTFETNTENVAVERDFNRINLEGHAPDAFEAGVAKFEGELAPALERTIATAGFQNDEDKNLILNLIANLALRNPRWREDCRQIREDIAKHIMELALSSKEMWESQVKRAQASGDLPVDLGITYEEMKLAQETEQYRLEVETDEHIRTEIKAVDGILPLLARRGWQFLKAPKESGGFITSDHPVALLWSAPKPRGPFNSPGFGLRGTEVLFPLSSRLTMIGAFELEDGTFEADEHIVAHANGITAAFATRQVYARDQRFSYVPKEGQVARKASRLISDPEFLRPK